MNGFWRRNLLVVITLLAFLFSALFYLVTTSSDSSELSAQQGQIDSLNNQIQIKKASIAADQASKNQDVSSLDLTRKRNDDAVLARLMHEATSWSTYSEYSQARKSIERTYGLDDKSSFMTSFMPAIPNVKDGDHYVNQIDTLGLNMSYSDLATYVSSIRGTDYTYLALVNVSTTSRDESTNQTTQVVVSYKTDSDHKITSIEAIPVPRMTNY